MLFYHTVYSKYSTLFYIILSRETLIVNDHIILFTFNQLGLLQLFSIAGYMVNHGDVPNFRRALNVLSKCMLEESSDTYVMSMEELSTDPLLLVLE